MMNSDIHPLVLRRGGIISTRPRGINSNFPLSPLTYIFVLVKVAYFMK